MLLLCLLPFGSCFLQVLMTGEIVRTIYAPSTLAAAGKERNQESRALSDSMLLSTTFSSFCLLCTSYSRGSLTVATIR